jgi:2-oxo-4-hydroxy-4-carboxy-5-ureidoimidazoline decarboxylase
VGENKMTAQQFKVEIFKCCGSTSWVQKLAEKFPFASKEELKEESDKIWVSLSEKDWKEAFTHHPKIGDANSFKKKLASTANWASAEQAEVRSAEEQTLIELKTGNDEYEKKFGYIFIVCATGKSAEEMLAMLKVRLKNSPQEEIEIAMQEQNKITHLRIDKLFA